MGLIATRAAASARAFGGLLNTQGEPLTDDFISNVVLLMHFEGANNSTTFTDVKGKTLTRVGSPVISTAFADAGLSSGLFNSATPDYLTAAASADFSFPGDFTIEITVNPNSITGNQQIIGNYLSNTTGHWMLRMQGAVPVWYVNGAAAFTANDRSWTIGTKHKVALVRIGSTCTAYIDGTVSGTPLSYSGTFGLSTNALGICAMSNGGTPISAYIDELRITKGVGRYTAPYIPRKSAFPDA